MDAQTSDSRGALSVVIVYFRTPDALNRSLAALRSQTKRPADVVVVDNSSTLDNCSDRPARGSDWEWLRSPENLGFGAACNVGAAATSGEFILFINADLELSSDACELLVQTAREHSDTAVVGPRVYAPNGQVELSARSFPSLFTGILGRRSLLTKVLRFLSIRPPGFALKARASSPTVDWVSGACMLVRRSAFEAIDGFDEGYWMYWEDADLCKRFRSSGWTTRLQVSATASHSTGSSGKSAQTIRAFHASAYRYHSIHIARGAVARIVGKLVLNLRCRAVLLSCARELSR